MVFIHCAGIFNRNDKKMTKCEKQQHNDKSNNNQERSGKTAVYFAKEKVLIRFLPTGGKKYPPAAKGGTGQG